MSDDLRRTVGDIEIARIRALAHGDNPEKKDHRDYLNLPPGSGTALVTRRSKIRTFFARFFRWL